MNIILEDKAEDVESADFRSDQVVKKKEPRSPNLFRRGMATIKETYAMNFKSNDATQKELIQLKRLSMTSDKQYRSAATVQSKHYHRRTPSENFIGATPPTRDLIVSENSISLDFNSQNNGQNSDDSRLPKILDTQEEPASKDIKAQQMMFLQQVKGPGRKIRDQYGSDNQAISNFTSGNYDLGSEIGRDDDGALAVKEGLSKYKRLTQNATRQIMENGKWENFETGQENVTEESEK